MRGVPKEWYMTVLLWKEIEELLVTVVHAVTILKDRIQLTRTGISSFRRGSFDLLVRHFLGDQHIEFEDEGWVESFLLGIPENESSDVVAPDDVDT
jgi:hypothetical protein